MKKNLFLIAIINIVLIGCNPDRFAPKFKISDKDVIKASTFKDHSYFIYKDSLTGIEDSFYCLYNTTIYDQNYFDRNDKLIKTVEHMDNIFSMNIPPDPSSFYNYETTDIIIRTTPDSIYMYTSKYKLFKGCYFKNIYNGENSNSLKKIVNLSINGKTYNNVFVSKEGNNYCYFNRDIGIIKLTALDSNGVIITTKELVRYSSLK